MNFSKTVCRILICLALSVASSIAEAQSKFNETRDIKYVERADAYSNERCKLDVKSPANAKALPVIVWFHGGGITAGNKHYPFGMENENGLVLVAVNYRLSPKIKAAEAVEDAADAVAWTFANIEKFGGDQKQDIRFGTFRRRVFGRHGSLCAEISAKARFEKHRHRGRNSA